MLPNAGQSNHEEEKAQKPPIKADFKRYDSSFMQLIAPLVATRYLWLAIEDINPLNFLKKPDPKTRPDFTAFKKPNFPGYMSRNFAAFGMGATFLGIVGLYSKNTLHDIKSLYAEAVGYELGRKTEDVTLSDVFLKSHNAALEVTRGAYTRRTLARAATAATFFLPWQIFRDFKDVKPKYDANANAGVGAVGVYLCGEGFLRNPSFFDAEQNLVSSSINHTDANPNEIIQPRNIQALLLLQRKHLNKKYQWPEVTSKDGQNELVVSERIADLLNQTYNNTPRTEPANLTIGKFNYLVGFGLLDHFPESLAFVELANKSPDMVDVKKAAAAIQNGQNPQGVFQPFGIDLTPMTKGKKSPSAHPEPTDAKFVALAPLVKDNSHHHPKTYQDLVAQTKNTPLSI